MLRCTCSQIYNEWTTRKSHCQVGSSELERVVGVLWDEIGSVVVLGRAWSNTLKLMAHFPVFHIRDSECWWIASNKIATLQVDNVVSDKDQ